MPDAKDINKKADDDEKKAAAELLNIHRTGLYQKMKKYDLN